MAVTPTVSSFKQVVWSKSILKSLEKITSLRNHCDFQYEKDTKNAKEVKILNVNRPSIHRYVPGTALERESIQDGEQTLKLDQFFYYNYEVEDIDKAQSVPGLMEATTDEAAQGLALEGDKYVASVIKTAVDGGDVTASASVTLTKSNAVEKVEEGFVALYENDCKINDTFYLELAPKVYSLFKQNLTETSTNNPELLKKGAIGKYNNALVCIENCLPTDETSVYNILRTNKAVAFAEQIDKVEKYRPQDAFTDAIKALYVFGARVVRPKEIYVLKTAK
jgi:hypothetical protein